MAKRKGGRGGGGHIRKKQKSRAGESASAAGRVAAMVMSNIRTGGFAGLENKFLDTELTTTSLAATWGTFNPTGTGSTNTLSVPVVGTGESERNGRMYTINSVMVRGVITSVPLESQGAPIADIRARVIVYWDTQTNSAEAVATDIMDGGATDDVLAFRNLQNTKRFIVLYDKSIVLHFNNQTNEGAINLFAAGSVHRPFSFYKRFKNGIAVQCDGTTANVSSVTDNNFGLAAVATTTNVQIAYQARIRFTG